MELNKGEEDERFVFQPGEKKCLKQSNQKKKEKKNTNTNTNWGVEEHLKAKSREMGKVISKQVQGLKRGRVYFDYSTLIILL